MLVKPNTFVLGRSVWTAVKRHPKVVAAVLGSASSSGRVTKEALADVLEIDRIIVGEGWVNTARKGQTANMVRCWGKHAALLYVNPNADTERGITFGLTAQWGTRIAAKREDGSGILRFEIAFGKAWGALGMGFGSRTYVERAKVNPAFVTALMAASGGRVVPVPSGVLIRDTGGQVIGAVGISGDTSDRDEICALAGIAAVGLTADPGGAPG